MRFIDTHAHIYLNDFEVDIENLLVHAKQELVEKIYMPNIDSSSIDDVHNLEAKFPDQCLAMMGLHPCYVKDNYKQELDIIEKKITLRKYAAVGEIGIDLYWDKSTFEIQKEAFIQQIKWSKELNIPVSIHSRDSLDITIQIIEELQDGNLSGIFHCFNGDEIQAERIKDAGFFMGIGGVVTFKKAGVDKTVAKLNLDNLVLETDAPYLSPTPHRGKRNSPVYIPIIAQKIADIQEIPIERVAEKTSENADEIFKDYKYS